MENNITIEPEGDEDSKPLSSASLPNSPIKQKQSRYNFRSVPRDAAASASGVNNFFKSSSSIFNNEGKRPSWISYTSYVYHNEEMYNGGQSPSVMNRNNIGRDSKLSKEQIFAEQISADVRLSAYDHCCKILERIYERVMHDMHFKVFDEVYQLLVMDEISSPSIEVDDVNNDENYFTLEDSHDHEYDLQNTLMPLILFRVKEGALNMSDRARFFHQYASKIGQNSMNGKCNKKQVLPICLIRLGACSNLAALIWGKKFKLFERTENKLLQLFFS